MEQERESPEEIINSGENEAAAPVDAELRVTLSADEMEAFLELRAPENGGKKMTVEQADSGITSSGVIFGIDHDVVQRMVGQEIYNTPACFARGLAPQNGEDAELTFFFCRDHSGAPSIDEDGKVDYRALDLYTSVKEGEKLVEKRPATAGTPGYTVKGRELKPTKGKDIRLPGGKNISYDEARLIAFSKINGRVDFVNNTLTVSDCYTIRGDADLSVGNIDFDGDVVVMGNVISDLSIKATRNIEIHGSAAGARLSAGGNIVLRGGMQGSDKGVLEANGDIRAKYIERALVKAGGSISVDSMIHCQTESGNSIEAKGKHGSIIGGTIRAQNSITALNIGSASNTKTEVSVGMAPSTRARKQFLLSELSRLRTELEKLEKACRYLSQTAPASNDRQELKKTVVLGKINHDKLIHEYEEELNSIEEMAKSSAFGEINVRDTVFPGVKISISLGEMSITNQIRFTTFTYKDREITLLPYRA